MGEGKKKDSIKREFAAGGAIFRGVKVLWLVTRSAPSKLYPEAVFRLPKGWLDDEDNGLKPGPLTRGEIKADEKTLRESAVREVAEEGGVKAKVVGKIGTDRLFLSIKERGKTLKFITWYLMEWESDLPEGHGFETSEVFWLPFDEARKKLSYSSEKKILDKAKKLLERPRQESLI